jgi:hypothetical protein
MVGAIAILWGAAAAAHAADDIFAVQARFSPPNYQLFLNLADDSSVASTGPLYGPAGGVYGMTFLGDTLYGVELASDFSADYLATIPHTGPLVGDGGRVSASPIGFANVEGLAAANGVLYGASIDYTAHQTNLITINPATGIGAAVGQGSVDVILVGLAFDPQQSILYGAGIPFGATGVNTPNLYTVNRTNGATSLVGNMGSVIQGLAWDSELGLVGAFDRLYQIDSQTGAAAPIGTTDFTQGVPGMGNGIYSLASLASTSAVPGDYNQNGTVDAADYTKWRNSLDGPADSLPNRNSLNSGVINAADYDFWKSRFGESSGSGSVGVAGISAREPATWIVLSLGMFALLRRRRGDAR